MNIRVAWVLALAVLAGCSSEWTAGLGQQQVGATDPAAGFEGSLPLADNARKPRTGGFAGAPDRGDLLQYPAEPVVRRTGAYTWHSAGLSEEHAMRAIVEGRMGVTAPDGTPIALDYVRHVEHPDGNWSWIGRNADAPGQDAVVTFGPEAVFGSIPQGGELPPLRLTMADGSGWVVSADPRQLSLIRNEATHPTRPDYLVPPKLSSAGTTAGGMTMAGAQAQSATTSATTTVDVLVGYTQGFASARGGTSAAVTRVHNLVDITNQAYVNSQVDARLRLVHSMQVTYPDTNDNGTALEELTGFQAPSTRTTPAPAFNGLRAARDQYGADLVVLVRRFQTPENQGCGIAWLIGGGRSGIEQRDEFFGYSVVGDGQDEGTDGKTYFCREETFAHEVGHNMGSQHDRETATDESDGLKYGVFDYSFGHKTDAVAGNLYTVMAYGDSGQTSYRVFSNPSITYCGGRACGVANQADNARSLRQVIPTLASFRGTVIVDAPTVLPKLDVDGSGSTDLMWFKPGSVGIWLMRGYTVTGQDVYSPASNLIPYVEGEFNDTDGRDIALRDNTGKLIFWLGGPTYRRSPTEYAMSLGWRLQASGDHNGDGISDLYWRSAADGRLMYWQMGANQQRVSYRAFAQSPDADLLMSGDFNGDGRSDLFFRTRADGASEIWLSSGTGYTIVPQGSMSKYWRPAGAADYDGDGDDDLVWRSSIDHRVLVWIMEDGVRQDLAVFNSESDRQLMMVGYLNDDRRLDLVWRRADGAVSTWLNTGSGFESRYVGVRDTSWSLFVGGR
ncbi:reprolysin-like metallopeptidase [Lysobacter sp. A3-1-A15]|uniref:reprolysin-like metallopeptidase n=1 Tax=Novilysobacter viscosus TaxID=3098602 RepID=UPI002ED84F99